MNHAGQNMGLLGGVSSVAEPTSWLELLQWAGSWGEGGGEGREGAFSSFLSAVKKAFAENSRCPQWGPKSLVG